MAMSIALFAFSLSLDALGAGMVYGLRNIKIPISSKLIICLFSILYSAFAILFGSYMAKFLSPQLSKYIGILILFTMGMWMLIQSFLKKDIDEGSTKDTHDKTLMQFMIKSLGITVQIIKNPVKGDMDNSGIIDKRESLLLGLALSIDSIGVGIGSALSGFNSMMIPLIVGFVQLIMLYLGVYLGMKFSKLENINKRLFSMLPGILLICLAAIRI